MIQVYTACVIPVNNSVQKNNVMINAVRVAIYISTYMVTLVNRFFFLYTDFTPVSD